MKKFSLFIISTFFLVFGFHILAYAQENQMGDMQKQMMEKMQQQMMKSMAGGRQAEPVRPVVSREKADAGVTVFSDTKLGTNGKSCKMCHPKPGIKPLDGRKVDAHLIASIQNCYSKAMEGSDVMPAKKLNSIVDLFQYMQN